MQWFLHFEGKFDDSPHTKKKASEYARARSFCEAAGGWGRRAGPLRAGGRASGPLARSTRGRSGGPGGAAR